MKTDVKIIGFDEEGRYEVDAILLAPGVAVLEERVGHTFYFVKVKPADEAGFWTETGPICDIAVMNGCSADIADIPVEALTFAMWAAGNPVGYAGSSVAV